MAETVAVESLEQVKGKHRLKKCAHGGCAGWAKFRFRTRTSRGNSAEWYVCSVIHAQTLASELAMVGLTVL